MQTLVTLAHSLWSLLLTPLLPSLPPGHQVQRACPPHPVRGPGRDLQGGTCRQGGAGGSCCPRACGRRQGPLTCSLTRTGWARQAGGHGRGGASWGSCGAAAQRHAGSGSRCIRPGSARSACRGGSGSRCSGCGSTGTACHSGSGSGHSRSGSTRFACQAGSGCSARRAAPCRVGGGRTCVQCSRCCRGGGRGGGGEGGAPRERLPGALAGPGGTRVGGEGDTVPPPPALVSDSRGHAVPDAPAEQPPSRAVAGEGRGGPTAWAGAEGVRVRVNVSADSVLFSFD